MPKRLTTAQREGAMEVCAQRDSGGVRRCRSCESRRNLTIDHIDDDFTNNAADGSNWQILCRGCNTAKANRHYLRGVAAEQQGGPHQVPGVRTLVGLESEGGGGRERERESESLVRRRLAQAREAIGGRDASSESQASDAMQRRFRAYVLRKVSRDGYITSKAAINGGAEALYAEFERGSPKTTRGWFDMLVSEEGPLEEDLHSYPFPVYVLRQPAKNKAPAAKPARSTAALPPLIVHTNGHSKNGHTPAGVR